LIASLEEVPEVHREPEPLARMNRTHHPVYRELNAG